MQGIVIPIDFPVTEFRVEADGQFVVLAGSLLSTFEFMLRKGGLSEPEAREYLRRLAVLTPGGAVGLAQGCTCPSDLQLRGTGMEGIVRLWGYPQCPLHGYVSELIPSEVPA